MSTGKTGGKTGDGTLSRRTKDREPSPVFMKKVNTAKGGN